MAKRKMRKMNKKTSISGIIGMVLGIVGIIGVGGLFVNGTMMSVVILKWLPLIVHQIVGWTMIVGAILSGALALMKR